MTGQSGAVASQITIPSGAASTSARQPSADQLIMTSLVPVSARGSLRNAPATPDYGSTPAGQRAPRATSPPGHASGPAAAAWPAPAPPSDHRAASARS